MYWDTTQVLLALLGGVFIAASSSLNLFLTGRITGMSSIFYTLINWDMKEGLIWKVMFVVGLIIPPYVLWLATEQKGIIEGISFLNFGYYNVWALLAGGILVGLGTKIGNGCTSGHAVCGIPRLAKRSIVATCLFLAFGLGVGTLFGYAGWLHDTSQHWGDDYLTGFKIASYIMAAIVLIGGVIMFMQALKNKVAVRELVLSLIVGLLFGVGLALSGMCNPKKIVAFLTLDDKWDPSLIFVMISAVGINLITFQLMLHNMEKPKWQGKFPAPKSEFDLPVILGPIIFGLGWGISGLCPGPGMINLLLLPQGFIFILSLALGQMIAGKLIMPFLSPDAGHTAHTPLVTKP
jgi:uncharacterized membrane protein YedE/YeeE